MSARVFADTVCFIAMLDPRDQWAGQCADVLADLRRATVTTDFVLMELANFMSRSMLRGSVKPMIDRLRAATNLHVVPAR